MKSIILQPDDFKVGMFVTIFDIKDKYLMDQEDMSNPIHSMMMQSSGLYSRSRHPLEALKGTIIRIDAINRPFIMTTVFESNVKPNYQPKTQQVPIDTREVDLMKLNKEYVDVYLGKNTVKHLLQDIPFDDIQDIPGLKELSELIEAFKQKVEKENKNED